MGCPLPKKKFYTPFYSNMMKQTRYFHNVQFLHFTYNRDAVDRMEENYERLQKIQTSLKF
jgi:hypothetical protein